MPTYVYKFVDTGETIEVQQSFTDATLTEAVHPTTGETLAVKKVFQPVGVTFKGSGFYKTDSRSGSSKQTSGKESGKDSGSSGESSGSSDSSSSASSGASKASASAGSSSPGPSSGTSSGSGSSSD